MLSSLLSGITDRGCCRTTPPPEEPVLESLLPLSDAFAGAGGSHPRLTCSLRAALSDSRGLSSTPATSSCELSPTVDWARPHSGPAAPGERHASLMTTIHIQQQRITVLQTALDQATRALVSPGAMVHSPPPTDAAGKQRHAVPTAQSADHPPPQATLSAVHDTLGEHKALIKRLWCPAEGNEDSDEAIAAVESFLQTATDSSTYTEIEPTLTPKSKVTTAPITLRPVVVLDVTSMFSCSPKRGPHSPTARRAKETVTRLRLEELERTVADQQKELEGVRFAEATVREEYHSALEELSALKEQKTATAGVSAAGTSSTHVADLEKQLTTQRKLIDDLKASEAALRVQYEAVAAKLDDQWEATQTLPMCGIHGRACNCRDGADLKELQRLRLLMRFSELKKDSDQLPNLAEKLLTAESEVKQLRRERTRLQAQYLELKLCVEQMIACSAPEVNSGNEDAIQLARTILNLCGDVPALESKHLAATGEPSPCDRIDSSSGHRNTEKTCRPPMPSRSLKPKLHSRATQAATTSRSSSCCPPPAERSALSSSTLSNHRRPKKKHGAPRAVVETTHPDFSEGDRMRQALKRSALFLQQRQRPHSSSQPPGLRHNRPAERNRSPAFYYAT